MGERGEHRLKLGVVKLFLDVEVSYVIVKLLTASRDFDAVMTRLVGLAPGFLIIPSLTTHNYDTVEVNNINYLELELACKGSSTLAAQKVLHST